MSPYSPDVQGLEVRPGRRNRSAPSLGTKLAFSWLSLMAFIALTSVFLVTFGFDGVPSVGLQDPNGLPFLVGSDATPNEGPSFDNWLGTDVLGRDNFARIWFGSRVPMVVATTGVLTGMTLGLFFGSLAGFKRGWLERIILFGCDVISAFPLLVVLLILVLVLGGLTLLPMALVFGIAAIPPCTREARLKALSVAEHPDIEAARSLGTGTFRIIAKDIIPKVASSVFGCALGYAAFAIHIEGALGFLGLSVQPPSPTWGTLLSTARFDLSTSIWPVIPPVLAIFLTALALNVLGEFYGKRPA